MNEDEKTKELTEIAKNLTPEEAAEFDKLTEYPSLMAGGCASCISILRNIMLNIHPKSEHDALFEQKINAMMDIINNTMFTISNIIKSDHEKFLMDIKNKKSCCSCKEEVKDGTTEETTTEASISD